MSLRDELKEFIIRGSVVDMAVGIVIGAAFTAIITGVVSGGITPLISLAGVPNLNHDVNVTSPVNGHTAQFSPGAIVNSLISFLIVALVVFFLIVKPVAHLRALQDRKKPKPEPTTKSCPECLSDIPIKATRCKFCASSVPPAPASSSAPPAPSGPDPN
jgi:large conductance mechanosensitive channel